jgi:hypothetical protein
MYIVGGHDFGALDRHPLLIDKALYGLYWRQEFADVLKNKYTCEVEQEIWMCEYNGLYEYLGV